MSRISFGPWVLRSLCGYEWRNQDVREAGDSTDLSSKESFAPDFAWWARDTCRSSRWHFPSEIFPCCQCCWDRVPGASGGPSDCWVSMRFSYTYDVSWRASKTLRKLCLALGHVDVAPVGGVMMEPLQWVPFSVTGRALCCPSRAGPLWTSFPQGPWNKRWSLECSLPFSSRQRQQGLTQMWVPWGSSVPGTLSLGSCISLRRLPGAQVGKPEEQVHASLPNKRAVR